MKNRTWTKRLATYVGIPVVVALAVYLVWDAKNGVGTAGVCAGTALVLGLAAMAYLLLPEIRAERDIAGRIRAEYPSGSQAQVLAAYNRLKSKELEYVFIKVLDDAKGNPAEVEKLCGIAESAGAKAFLEDRW